MNNILNDSFDEKQKLSCITLLNMIAQGGEKHFAQLREKYILAQIHYLGLTEFEYDTHLKKGIDPNFLQTQLQSLNEKQIDLLIGMTIDLLNYPGIPTERDVLITENCFVKIVGLSADQFHDKIEKMFALTNHFNDVPQYDSQRKNVVDKTFERMINEANDPNESTFSLNNIVFLVFVTLAILGLFSLCS
tara:strand:+ start:1230 stop:1799 length:570 start_codon:yes stop_codon:yes gene_type:complete